MGDHIKNIAWKASRILRFIQRVFRDCPDQVRETAYTTLVRPILEYSASVWNPHQVVFSQELEKVQRRAARFVRGNFDPMCSVSNMIASLGWDSLAVRRDTLSMNFFMKIVQGKTISDVSLTVKNTGSTRLRHNKHLVEMRARTDSFFWSFYPRVIRGWNALPKVVISEMDTIL